MKSFFQISEMINYSKPVPIEERPYQSLRELLKTLNKRQQIQFSLYCASQVVRYMENQLGEYILELAKKYLQNKNSVDINEIRDLVFLLHDLSIDSGETQSYYAIQSLQGLVNTIIMDNNPPYADCPAYIAAHGAITCFVMEGDFEEIWEQKTIEYSAVANSLKATSNKISKTNTPLSLPEWCLNILKTLTTYNPVQIEQNKKIIIEDLSILFDFMLNNDFDLFHEDKDGIELVFFGLDLKGKNVTEIATKVINFRHFWLFEKLLDLYN